MLAAGDRRTERSDAPAAVRNGAEHADAEQLPGDHPDVRAAARPRPGAAAGRTRAASGLVAARTRAAVTANSASVWTTSSAGRRRAPYRRAATIATGTITRVDAACEAKTCGQVVKKPPPSKAATVSAAPGGDHQGAGAATPCTSRRKSSSDSSRGRSSGAALSMQPGDDRLGRVGQPEEQRDVEVAAAGQVRGCARHHDADGEQAATTARGARAKSATAMPGRRPPGRRRTLGGREDDGAGAGDVDPHESRKRSQACRRGPRRSWRHC